MKHSNYQEKMRKKRRQNFRFGTHRVQEAYAQDLLGWEPRDDNIRCPECRPTAVHKANLHCRLCGGGGQTNINVAQSHILGEED